MNEQLKKSEFNQKKKQQINQINQAEQFEEQNKSIIQENKELVSSLISDNEVYDENYQSKIERTTALRKIKKPINQSEFKNKKRNIKGDIQKVPKPEKRASIDANQLVQRYEQADDNQVKEILEKLNWEEQKDHKVNHYGARKKNQKNLIKVVKTQRVSQDEELLQNNLDLLQKENIEEPKESRKQVSGENIQLKQKVSLTNQNYELKEIQEVSQENKIVQKNQTLKRISLTNQNYFEESLLINLVHKESKNEKFEKKISITLEELNQQKKKTSLNENYQEIFLSIDPPNNEEPNNEIVENKMSSNHQEINQQKKKTLQNQNYQEIYINNDQMNNQKQNYDQATEKIIENKEQKIQRPSLLKKNLQDNKFQEINFITESESGTQNLDTQKGQEEIPVSVQNETQPQQLPNDSQVKAKFLQVQPLQTYASSFKNKHKKKKNSLVRRSSKDISVLTESKIQLMDIRPVKEDFETIENIPEFRLPEEIDLKSYNQENLVNDKKARVIRPVKSEKASEQIPFPQNIFKDSVSPQKERNLTFNNYNVQQYDIFEHEEFIEQKAQKNVVNFEKQTESVNYSMEQQFKRVSYPRSFIIHEEFIIEKNQVQIEKQNEEIKNRKITFFQSEQQQDYKIKNDNENPFIENIVDNNLEDINDELFRKNTGYFIQSKQKNNLEDNLGVTFEEDLKDSNEDKNQDAFDFDFNDPIELVPIQPKEEEKESHKVNVTQENPISIQKDFVNKPLVNNSLEILENKKKEEKNFLEQNEINFLEENQPIIKQQNDLKNLEPEKKLEQLKIPKLQSVVINEETLKILKEKEEQKLKIFAIQNLNPNKEKIQNLEEKNKPDQGFDKPTQSLFQNAKKLDTKRVKESTIETAIKFNKPINQIENQNQEEEEKESVKFEKPNKDEVFKPIQGIQIKINSDNPQTFLKHQIPIEEIPSYFSEQENYQQKPSKELAKPNKNLFKQIDTSINKYIEKDDTSKILSQINLENNQKINELNLDVQDKPQENFIKVSKDIFKNAKILDTKKIQQDKIVNPLENKLVFQKQQYDINPESNQLKEKPSKELSKISKTYFNKNNQSKTKNVLPDQISKSIKQQQFGEIFAQNQIQEINPCEKDQFNQNLKKPQIKFNPIANDSPKVFFSKPENPLKYPNENLIKILQQKPDIIERPFMKFLKPILPYKSKFNIEQLKEGVEKEKQQIRKINPNDNLNNDTKQTTVQNYNKEFIIKNRQIPLQSEVYFLQKKVDNLTEKNKNYEIEIKEYSKPPIKMTYKDYITWRLQNVRGKIIPRMIRRNQGHTNELWEDYTDLYEEKDKVRDIIKNFK